MTLMKQNSYCFKDIKSVDARKGLHLCFIQMLIELSILQKLLVILASAKIILLVTTISDTAMKDNYQKLLFL